MEYKVREFNGCRIDADGTSLQGQISAPYDILVKLFGYPDRVCDKYKVDANWSIKFKDNTIATIYNWKNGKHYCGESGLNVEDITEWHVGGKNPKAVEHVREVLFSKM